MRICKARGRTIYPQRICASTIPFRRRIALIHNASSAVSVSMSNFLLGNVPSLRVFALVTSSGYQHNMPYYLSTTSRHSGRILQFGVIFERGFDKTPMQSL